jgi:uncharacterized membrane protein
MPGYHIAFESPWYLVLLGLVPVLWWFSYRSLGVLGRWRRLAALSLRTAVLVLLVLALAEAQMVRTSDRLTAIFLLDQSMSIPPAQRRAMAEYVNEAILDHRREGDRVGVVVFGGDAAIEIPPFDDDVQMQPRLESFVDPEYTNLAAAMKLAQASFPEDAAKRIVVVSDGNENLGNALEQARGLAAAGIGLDAVPVRYQSRSEIVMERLTIPSDVRRGEPFELRAVLNNTADERKGDAAAVRGRLVLSQKTGDRTITLSDEKVTLPPGKRVLSIQHELELPDFYTFEARFVPDDPAADGMPQNNRASTFTHVRGRGQILLVENRQSRGQFDLLVERLRQQDLEVHLRPSDQLFSSLGELQPYDAVLLADVPREDFTEAQIDMLVRNTQQMGSGLLMLGGPNSFGAGGWANTSLEEAMPVDFQIRSAKVVPRGALAMLMHASEIARGNHWQKVIGGEALKALGARDYCGVVHWDGVEKWLWRPGMREVGGNRDAMLARIDRMLPGDMPTFDPAMVLARQAFAKLKTTAVKHMIIISDGDPSPPSRAVIQALVDLSVTVTTVAVGAHGPANSAVLQRLAQNTGGKYYTVNNPRALPRIFQREARRVARPLIWEDSAGVQPRIRFPHEMLRGIDAPLPTMRGFVLTTVKENPLVEVALVSPKPAAPENNTVLAGWTYGLGKAVAFTSDAGARWTSAWTAWPEYDKLFSQMVRWTMRPVGQSGKFSVSTDIEDGRVKVVVTALDRNDEFLNFLDMRATVVGPDLKPIPLDMRQTAPGRYEGSFDSPQAGSYFVMIQPGAGQSPVRTGVNVPYSAEYRDRATNRSLLVQLAELQPEDGTAGRVVELPDLMVDTDEPLDAPRPIAYDPFRHDLPKATSSQDIWPYLVFLGSCLFFLDVFIRRVQVGFAWVPTLAGRLRDQVLGTPRTEAEPEYMDRLRSRKQAVSQELDDLQRRARFEAPEAADAPPTDAATEAETRPPEKRPGAPSMTTQETPEAEGYTQRLLRAKKEIWEQQQRKKHQEGGQDQT